MDILSEISSFDLYGIHRLKDNTILLRSGAVISEWPSEIIINGRTFLQDEMLFQEEISPLEIKVSQAYYVKR